MKYSVRYLENLIQLKALKHINVFYYAINMIHRVYSNTKTAKYCI